MKILAVQNRMGIGDMVIFLPFIEAISKKFKSPVSLLVKESSKQLITPEEEKGLPAPGILLNILVLISKLNLLMIK